MLKVVAGTQAVEGALGPQTLDEVALQGARKMLRDALELEVAAYLERHQVRDERGHALVVRNGQARARQVTCGAGTLTVRAPRVNDRRVDAQGQRQRFTSRILPPYMRRSPMLAPGCRVFLSPAPFDHAKLMVVDRAWTMFGSTNWDPRSLRLNFELDVECYDATLAATVDDLVAERRGGSREITLAEVDGRPLPIRLRDGVARLFSPYL